MVQPRTGHCLALLCAATRALATGASTEPCVELSEPNSRAWAVRTSPLTRRMHPCSLSLSALRCERASEVHAWQPRHEHEQQADHDA